jgi:uncharacterized protein YdaU (DUF1376 family)
LHYYKRNLGDYAKKAGRLSILQHGVYNLLIDACYDREQFPTRDEAIDWTWASSAAEIEAVDFVLRKFFTLVDGRYVQARIEEEIAEYREKADKNKRTAEARESTKRAEKSTSRARVVEETAPNQEPRTKNQEPKESSASSGHQQHGGPPGGPDGPARAGLPENPCTPVGGGGEAAVQVAQAAGTAMRAAGLADVSDSHPRLLALLAGGITVAELADAARVAVQKGRGFPWALGRAEGQRQDAASSAVPLPAAAPPVDPDGRAAIEADGERFGLGRWQQLDAQGRAVPWAAYAAKVKARRAAEAGQVTA